MTRCSVEQRSRIGELINALNQIIVRAVKRKMNDYLCTSEELEVTKMEAACVPVDFPVVKILIKSFSPLANKRFHDNDSKTLKMILKAVTELSSKLNELTAYIKSSSMGAKDRCSDNIDTSSLAFLLKTPEELRTIETALEGHKFRYQFVTRSFEVVCDDRKSTKAYLAYVLTQELAITYTLHGIKSKLGISDYRFHSTIQDVLRSQLRSATYPGQEITQAMDIAGQTFLHDSRDKVNKRGWPSEERVS
uniref:DUF4806 domain-containing protein n=1 Tax=Schistosoma mansoni TaxID=6183 RepID=A0A5K4F4J6_SCHMA